MTVFKCKMCGGDLSFNIGDKIATCEYCGRKQTLPSIYDDKKISTLYNRANAYRVANEFDKAANIYNQIIVENSKDSEAYWNLALCNYGVVYVKDPKTNEYVPTCNRTQYLSIFSDENYKKALEYASEEQVAIFEKDARYIDDVQKEIIKIAKSEKPFDIFICYKETAQNGARSKDSIKAQELYDELTSQGYKVFFSRITLESKIGTEYEPYIYAALASSKVMIHITSSKENSESVWVKNEWSRYLSLSSKSNDKTFIPAYFDVNKDELPEEFTNIPSYDMNTDGFTQELIRGIKKLIPTPIMKLQRRKKSRKIFGIIGAALVVVLVAIGIYSYPKIEEYLEYKDDYDAAMQLYYDKNYPEATWAFEELGDFLDSKEMKTTAEGSWRKSLATITAKDLDSYSLGKYYVDSNGAVSTFDGCSGNSHENINIEKHGKVISLGVGKKTYALHEDGYVSNAVENNHLEDDSEWHNIVKISCVFNYASVALRSDGKMVFGKTQNEELSVHSDPWLEKLSEWENIVDFTWSGGCNDGNYGAEYGSIIGLKADGSLVAVEGIIDEYGSVLNGDDLNNIVSNFKNVKVLKNSGCDVFALTTDGKLQTYIDGKFSETEVEDVYDIRFSKDYYDDSSEKDYIIYLLKTNGDCIDMESGNVLFSDVIYSYDDYIVTRTGTIYSVEMEDYNWLELTVVPENVETIVHDEWLERLK